MNAITGGKRRATRRLAIFGLVASAACATTAPAPVQPAAWGFAAPRDPHSDSSIHANAAHLDAIVSGWIQLDSVTGRPTLLYPDDPQRIPAPTRRLALVTSWEAQRFHPDAIRLLAHDAATLARAAATIGDIVAQHRYAGIEFDLEGQSREDLPLTLAVIRAVRDSTRRRGPATIVVALPASDTAAYPTRAFAAEADNVMIMLYDEHTPTSSPGPVTSPLWVRRALAQRVSDVGAARVIAAFPLYSYLWRPNQPAQMLSYNEAVHAATEANVEIRRDPTSQALHAVQPGSWELWITDAEQLRALRAEATEMGVGTVAYWRLGQEQSGPRSGSLSDVRP
jgi:spore germination protein YaaH